MSSLTDQKFVIGSRVRIADTGPNSIVKFWSDRIGREGVIVDIKADGLFDIMLDGQLIPGIYPPRLELVPAPTIAQIITTQKTWHRFITTVLVIVILVVITGIAYLIRNL